MAFRFEKVKCEETVDYKIFPLLSSSYTKDDLQTVLQNLFLSCKDFLNSYIWQNEPFNLNILTDKSKYVLYLTKKASMCASIDKCDLLYRCL